MGERGEKERERGREEGEKKVRGCTNEGWRIGREREGEGEGEGGGRGSHCPR